MTDAIISADPQFLPLAIEELDGRCKQLRRQVTLADGVEAISFKGSFAALGEQLRQHRPIFLRHIMPVEQTVELSGDPQDIDLLRKTVRTQFSEEFATGSTFSIQTRIISQQLSYKAFAVNRALSDTVSQQSGAQLDVRNPHQIISCVIADLDNRPVAFLGYSLADHNLSNWAGGERRFKREKGQLSRAEFKLLEAIEWFQINVPEQGEALDLGAAPGGWSRVLRLQQPGLKVVAVDPAALHPSLAQDRMVDHVRLHADHFYNSLLGDERFVMIVNDMRLDARDSAEMMLTFSGHLAADGCALMTIKLPQYHPQQRLQTTLRILGRRYNIIGVKQLFHNRSEVTAFLVPRL